jgi:helicase
VSRQVGQVDTLFCHAEGEDVRVAAIADGERTVWGVLELKETAAGPRPARLRIKRDGAEEPRPPDEFVDLARRARRIRVAEQTPPAMRTRISEMLDAYQLEATVVRTCRICTGQTRYSPITGETAIDYGDGQICPDCARAELVSSPR